MHLLPRAVVAPLLVLLISTSTLARAQQPAVSPPTREQIHPELVDTTWGRRSAAAWQLAFDRRYGDAQARFQALHVERPAAVDPLLGLAFVARVEGRRSDARRWMRAAYAVEPSETIGQQLVATDYDRATSFDLSAGAATASGTTTSEWSAGVVAWLDPRFAVVARAAAIGAGDPIRGIFLDSANGSRARMFSGGVVVRPIDGTTLGARFEHWTSTGRDENYVYLDAAQRLSDNFVVHVDGRPVSGVFGAPQIGGGVDIVFIPSQIVTLGVQQGLRGTAFEPRTQASLFYIMTPSARGSVRVGAIRDIDPVNSATTGVVSGTWFATPTTGVRLELSARRGTFERSSVDVGLVLRR
jgi:hypothetical protein